MKYLNLTLIKKHLNIDEEFKDDDLYLVNLANVAEEMVSRHIDRNLDEYSKLPAPIQQAALLLVGNMYRERESISLQNMSEIPLSYQYLLATYKNRTNFAS